MTLPVVRRPAFFPIARLAFVRVGRPRFDATVDAYSPGMARVDCLESHIDRAAKCGGKHGSFADEMRKRFRGSDSRRVQSRVVKVTRSPERVICRCV